MGRKRTYFLMLLDLAAISISALAANYLRFDSFVPAEFPEFQYWLALDVTLTPIVFYFGGLYRNTWRYAGLSEIRGLFLIVSARTLLLMSLFIFLGYDRGVPRSIVVLQAILVLLAVSGTRLMPRMRRDIRQHRNLRNRTPIFIIGAGDAGETILRELMNNGTLTQNAIGFIDDDPSKKGERIHGVPVLGDTIEMTRLANRFKVQDAIIAIPSASGPEIRNIYRQCKVAGIRPKTVPPVSQLFEGRLNLSQVRNIDLEDLLGRDPVKVDLDFIRSRLKGKSVLITGGAGSIGREIARQVAGLNPKQLVVFDRAETSIYFTELSLKKRFPWVAIDCVIGDIKDADRLDWVMRKFSPQIVFHAAAFKHVPVMEAHPTEAFKNNIIGTRNVAMKAAEHGVERFVMISTDKAVNPVGIMGATKRLAEFIVGQIPGETKFVSVRFGNVLGSDGSVVPLFKKQISEGGPVTITHPEVTRYFMTIEEAVQLVMQAGSMGVGGEVYLLDMGDPIRIVDLAYNLIELSGFRPIEDIDIVYTGLRPGEKLHEELTMLGEAWSPTSHEKVSRLKEERAPAAILERIAQAESRLTGSSSETDQIVRQTLSSIIPEFGRGAQERPAPPSRRPSRRGRPPLRAV